jgi:hypothetical protein
MKGAPARPLGFGLGNSADKPTFFSLGVLFPASKASIASNEGKSSD